MNRATRTTFAIPSRLVHAGLVMLVAFLLVWATHYPGDSTAVEQGESLGLTLIVLAGSSVGLIAWMFAAPIAFRWRETSFWLDAIVLILAAWVGLSAWINAGIFTGWSPPLGGDLRASTNEAWWWVAAAAWWVMLRKCMGRSSARLALTGMLAGLGVLLAVHTFHQLFVSFPETLAAYEADPDAQLARIGIGAPPGSAARMIFENRLRDGGPTATFALANSLAGPLAMLASACLAIFVTVMTSGINRSSGRYFSNQHLAALAFVAAVTLIVLAALSVTGSRAGVLAVAIMSTVLVSLTLTRNWLDARRRILIAISGAGILFLAVAVVAADSDSWSQAPATLQLRAQYWLATWAMVADHPWFGVGPGNFQLVYQAYRDIAAHELIAEPHNFFFETLACGGWVAAVMLVAFLIVATRACWKGPQSATTNSTESTKESNWMGWSAGTGGLIGLLWVWYDGIRRGSPPDFEAHQWGVPLAIATIGGWFFWVRSLQSEIDCVRAGRVAAGTGLLHLCFSGGWTVPGVVMVLACFAAMALPSVEEPDDATESAAHPGIQSLRWIVVIVSVGMVWFLFAFSLKPVGQTDQAMNEAERALGRNQVARGKRVLQAAITNDWLATDPAIWLAAIENRELLERGAVEPMSQKSRSVFSRAVDRIGNDPAKLKVIGELHLHRYQVTGQENDLIMASEVYDRMISLSPTHQAFVAQAAEIAREQSRLDGSPPERAEELVRRTVELCEAGGVITRAIDFQMILPCRKIGRPAIQAPIVRPADEVFSSW